jgi:hypothetical protein
VHGRLCKADAVGEIAEAEPARVLAERLEDPDSPVDRLNCLARYCRTPFDIVE